MDNTKYTKNIICPYCGYEDKESWEYEDEGSWECENCENEFVVVRHIDITYSTYQ